MIGPNWINKRALLLLHQESLAEFGGASGIRDEGLLDSALAKAPNVAHYEPKSTLARLAAAHGYGIAKNHAFVDGNKRAALLAIGLFLAINGQQLVVDQVEAINVMLSLAGGETTEPELTAWIATHLKSAG